MEKDLCRRIALGGLIQGCFHNLNGNLQTLSFHLQFLRFKKGFLASEEISNHIEKAFLTLQKIQKQVKATIEKIIEEKEGPWDLKEILEEEIIFWENFLPFKHKVNKKIEIHEKKVEVRMPLNLLKGILCNIAYEVFPSLEEGNLIFLLKSKPFPQVVISFDKKLKEEVIHKLKILSKIFENLVELKIDETEISLSFYG